jgi:CTP-dependent riboflavin kinase
MKGGERQRGRKIMAGQRITGVVFTGVGQATGFTRLDWARAAFMREVGIDPHPGTVNIRVEDAAARDGWARVQATPGIVIHPPRTDWCDARLFKARIADSIDAAIVVPDIGGYPKDQIELIAPVMVRDALGLKDDDAVTIEVDIDG